MKYLFDSQGQYIAYLVDDQLYSSNTNMHIGRYHKQLGVFSDMYGQYLGEIGSGNRLLYNLLSPSRFTNFGSLSTKAATAPTARQPVLAVSSCSQAMKTWIRQSCAESCTNPLL